MARTVQMTAKDAGHGSLVLHQEWISGDGAGTSFDLTCGAGLGNTVLRLRVEFKNGDVVVEEIDMSEAVQRWVGAIVMEANSSDGN
jgi:hypothetical protein